MTQNEVFDLIGLERESQDCKWGEQNHDPFTWLAILGEEVGEVNRAALNARFTPFSNDEKENLEMYSQELIQVAAVAVAMVECLERKKWIWLK